MERVIEIFGKQKQDVVLIS